MIKDKISLMIELVTTDVISAIMEETAVSVQEAMRIFYNSEIFERLNDPQTELYRESGGYIFYLYKNWHNISELII